MEIKIYSTIDEIPTNQWNQLVQDNNPFLKHEFLNALERNACISQKLGYEPCHIAIFENQELKAAMPLYKKYNSSGEFVFDYAWADAYQKSGIHYYPKLVSYIPYTPAIGQRFLCRADEEEKYIPLLLESSIQLAKKMGASSFHCLFPDGQTHELLKKQGLISRYDCQFYWHNADYPSFDDFLANLSSRKRKNIKRERRKVRDSGIQFRLLDGHTATEKDWEIFTGFYEKTHIEKYNIPKFNHDFFTEIAKTLADQIFLVMAERENISIAAALMYRSDTHLYGRHWGASEQFDGLHFETCYYLGIEYCIKEKLQCFEPGVQGEHKIARGFIPTRTASSHWIADPRFSNAIKRYCEQEESAVDKYIKGLEGKNPYLTGC